MRLESAQELKQRLLTDIIIPLAAHATRVRVAGARAVATAAVAGAEPLAVFGVGARPFDKVPQIQRSVALGVARHQGEYRLAVRVQRPALLHSPMLEHVRLQAKGEVEIRVVGRIDKRATRVRAATAATAHAATPWYQRDMRPLLIGASVGHYKVTAGTTGAFLKRGTRTYLLSNNHVLANDGGKQPAERVARLRYWVRLKKTSANLVD